MEISRVPSYKKPGFGSVIKTDDNDITQLVYNWVKKQPGESVDIIKKEHFGKCDTEGSFLLLIDDENGKEASAYADIEKEFNKKIKNIYTKPVSELEKMVPKKIALQIRKEAEDPLHAQRLRGDNQIGKLLNIIEANLENKRADKVQALYEVCSQKAKTISKDEIFKSILKLFKS